ncbi:uncharacterized protein PHALS_14731 [Plasmopara halstedii]|uniref:Uncharacterized protein n=1 Tax=Plasmopara halstedii TaxID=4781 RepID=A0A0P1A4N8_PLAHL|nr:uncharacterized protein PHALS_14731 [Plasmopara halstedii]CEG35119.1 hypothetical protein PHALS_14731 [Plasmopara halstedii]|eukprot:XP_024571488.1 hypothetical protein PHALS_14731 [Plasmopara halstedii]
MKVNDRRSRLVWTTRQDISYDVDNTIIVNILLSNILPTLMIRLDDEEASIISEYFILIKIMMPLVPSHVHGQLTSRTPNFLECKATR